MLHPLRTLSIFGNTFRNRWLDWRGGTKHAPVSLIRAGTEVHGSVSSDERSEVLVEGTLHGDIERAGVVYVASKGRVLGSIEAGEVIIAGEAHGDVHARKRCEVHETGKVFGAVFATACLFLEGARVEGNVRIGDVDAALVAAKTRRTELPEPPAVPPQPAVLPASRGYRVTLEL